MSYNCIFDVLKSCEVDNNFDDILNYIISKNTHDFEKEYMAKIDKFEQLYNRLYKEQKKQYYLSNNIYNSCKYKSEISLWMIERLVYLDLEDSINKYMSSGIINYINKKLIK